MNAANNTPSTSGRRVLSIQSHVVHGYVGNKCCVFPLQVLGFEVDPICSVQFSNHTGYESWKGTVTTAEQLWDLIEGLQANDLLSYTHLVTGYIGSVGLLQVIKRVVLALRAVNPGLVYVCDPVLGDDGKLYLPAQMVDLYRSDVLQLATVLTPNQFEAEQLTRSRISSQQDALRACLTLLVRGPKTVVLTSFSAAGVADELLLIAATSVPQREGSWQTLKLSIPRLEASFTGTGDLLTALLLARLDEAPDDLKTAVELAIGSLQGIVLKTYEASLTHLGPKESTPQVMKMRELQLIPNQQLLKTPDVTLHAEQLLLASTD